MRKSLESFAHKAAKNLVADWLRAASIAAKVTTRDPNPDVECMGISWRLNRADAPYGIWTEYPIIADGTGAINVWDECSEDWTARPPTYQELIARGKPPIAIVDVAIQHKGYILAVIEIEHKHPLSDAKRDFLFSMSIPTVIALPSAWVLGQVEIPQEIPDRFYQRPSQTYLTEQIAKLAASMPGVPVIKIARALMGSA